MLPNRKHLVRHTDQAITRFTVLPDASKIDGLSTRPHEPEWNTTGVFQPTIMMNQ